MNRNLSLRKTAEHVFALVSLLFLIGALRPVYTDLRSVWGFDHTAGNTTYQGMSIAIYLVAVATLLIEYRRTTFLILRNWLLIVFVLFTVVSALWAFAPDVSLRRSLALVGTTILAFFFVVRFRPHEFLELLGWAFAITAIENLIVVILLPHVGVSSYPHTGAWQGVLGHKNELGRIMLLGALVLWIVSKQRWAGRSTVWAGVLLCLALVIFSQSRTAWVVLVLLLVAIPFLRFLRRPEYPLMFRFVLICAGIAGAAILLFLYLDAILILLERDTTLSDRTDIWATGFEVGKNSPWLGYGYRSFWLGSMSYTRYEVGHGHNSFLDLWVELGIVGLGLFLLTLALFTRRALLHLINSHDALGLWYMLIVIYIVLFSMTSKVIPDQGTITWILYVAGLLYLSPVPRAIRSPSGSRMIFTYVSKV